MTDVSTTLPSPLGILPARDEIAAHLLLDETHLVDTLIETARFGPKEKVTITALARSLVLATRAKRMSFGGIDAFTHEYGLTSQEGVMLMCLAEALLRIPDAETADRLIADKIGGGAWEKHLGHSPSMYVNASTWGLMLTGHVIDLKQDKGGNAISFLKRQVARSGEPIIRQALRHAMRILGRQFVLGRDMDEALARAKPDEAKGYRFSFDMLGEAARTAPDAEYYFDRYMAALLRVAESAGPPEARTEKTLMARPGISVKLSALHPRFEPSQEARLRRQLGVRLVALARTAKEHWLTLTVDAEEADKLDITLQIFADALSDPRLEGWNGFGIAVQAYGKRALPVLHWLRELSVMTRRRIPLRLVKGAYWDSEIKFAQQKGLADYPVFTRKGNTDVCYLACTRYLIENAKYFYPQFATHNAHTIAAVATLTHKDMEFELQRLHGMGEGLYEEVIREDALNLPCRIYAPVGGHEDLLAYLVRRLLENGANTSFVNRIADDAAPIEDIIRDPISRVEDDTDKSHALIPRPPHLFVERRASAGQPLWERPVRAALTAAMDLALSAPIEAGPVVDGEIYAADDTPASPITSPHDRRKEIGRCRDADAQLLDIALSGAERAGPDWDKAGGAVRAQILEKTAELIENDRPRLMALLVREAGKTLPDAQDDVREAADFLRYYAKEARHLFGGPQTMIGPTGEHNQYALHARGPFACISPWNFPLAIFCGQVAAALAAGNAVLAKPAEQTPLIAFEAVKLFHEAGVPPDILHFLPGGAQTGAALVAERRTKGIAFTGSNETASAIYVNLAARGGAIVPLIAETGGINAMIVDSSALPEQVVVDVLRSAFNSAGQRCSALRVLFVQKDIADQLITMLAGAMEELVIGDPWDFATDVGPVIDEEARTKLEAHKDAMRASAREIIDLPLPGGCAHGTYVTPAAYELQSLDELTRETFGPILHIIRYDSARLADVCEAINKTGFGLTLGLHSRIGHMADFVKERVRVGNFYVNRDQIGAMVGAQPFGGEGLSGTGPKAGGPHYLPRFAVERTMSVNVAATGGNVSLLSLKAGAGRKPN